MSHYAALSLAVLDSPAASQRRGNVGVCYNKWATSFIGGKVTEMDERTVSFSVIAT